MLTPWELFVICWPMIRLFCVCVLPHGHQELDKSHWWNLKTYKLSWSRSLLGTFKQHSRQGLAQRIASSAKYQAVSLIHYSLDYSGSLLHIENVCKLRTVFQTWLYSLPGQLVAVLRLHPDIQFTQTHTIGMFAVAQSPTASALRNTSMPLSIVSPLMLANDRLIPSSMPSLVLLFVFFPLHGLYYTCLPVYWPLIGFAFNKHTLLLYLWFHAFALAWLCVY